MEFSNDKKHIIVFSKKINFETAINRLSELCGEQTRDFFSNRGIKLPRKLNTLALTSVLNERIKELNSLSLSKEAFTKLEYYPDFTEYQLVQLFNRVATPEDFVLYRKKLWTYILKNYNTLNLVDGEMQYLLTVKKDKIEEIETYFEFLAESEFDFDNEFDGIPKDQIEGNLKKSFSSDDIHKLGHKYGIDIPNRLKKEDLFFYLKEILKSKRKLTKAVEKELETKTVVDLNNFCKSNRIPISTNLKKNELIYLFMFLLNQTTIPGSWITGVEDEEQVKPLKFTVDVSVVDAFGRGEPKKVIYVIEEPEDEEEPETKEKIIPFTYTNLNVPPIEKPVETEEENIEPIETQESLESEELLEPEDEEEPEETEKIPEPEDEEEETDDSEEISEPEEEEETEDEEEEIDESEEFSEPEEEEETEDEEEINESEELPEPEDDDEDYYESEEFLEPEELEESEELLEPEDDDEEDFGDLPEPEDDEEEPVEDEVEVEGFSDEDFDFDDDEDILKAIEEKQRDSLVEEEPEAEEEETDESEELSEPEEKESKKEPKEKPKPLADESYDEEFVKENQEDEAPNNTAMPNPYFRSKKLLSKKKKIITTTIAIVAIAAVLVGAFFVLKAFK